MHATSSKFHIRYFSEVLSYDTFYPRFSNSLVDFLRGDFIGCLIKTIRSSIIGSVRGSTTDFFGVL